MQQWLRSGKLKKAYPTNRTNIGVQSKKHTPLPAHCVGVCFLDASGYVFLTCRRVIQFELTLSNIMLLLLLRKTIQFDTYESTAWALQRGGGTSTDPEAYPRSMPRKNTQKSAKKTYPVVWGMLVSSNPYVCSIRRVCFLHFVRKNVSLLQL